MKGYIYNKTSDELYNRLIKIYNDISNDKIEVFGLLDFEIVERIDNKDNRIAKLKGNKILVKIDAIKFPDEALKYIIAHEVAHIISKGHREKYWDIVKTIYPDFEEGKKVLNNYLSNNI